MKSWQSKDKQQDIMLRQFAVELLTSVFVNSLFDLSIIDINGRIVRFTLHYVMELHVEKPSSSSPSQLKGKGCRATATSHRPASEVLYSVIYLRVLKRDCNFDCRIVESCCN
ncbi:hypothetical protein L2E82_11096 [Cichorium intybus]|uniref:Uncharacterized protein n=1 Tax=Cichorium intybus TaxID=13427 RepID=A0ACB9GCE1_CICIN|nr:hypothetical protein L2E82_11096 [Cichorium intybus]